MVRPHPQESLHSHDNRRPQNVMGGLLLKKSLLKMDTYVISFIELFFGFIVLSKTLDINKLPPFF